MSNFELVKKFHALVDDDPSAYADLMERRRELIEEEVAEAFEAMEHFKESGSKTDKAHVVKELCDVLHLVYGTLELMRVDADAAFAEVSRSNMTKQANPTGGKALKGEGYQPAQMEQFV
jgi:predicted HAD superfamily Cof-like phosphohydrolase